MNTQASKFNKNFSKEETQMINKQKKCLFFRGMPIKIVSNLHLTPIRKAVTNKTLPNVGENIDKWAFLYNWFKPFQL